MSDRNAADPDVAAVAAARPPAGDAAWPTLRQAYYAAWVLAAVSMCDQLNNGVISLLVEPIKRDLALTDLQMSYLLGFASILFYVLVGIPAARLVDRYNRKWLMTGAVLFWSAATAACGLAQNFWQFFGARFGIGAGESINAPLSYSMLADYFSPAKLPRAIAVYNVGFTMGAALSLLLGAWMIHLLAGLPTIEVPLFGVVKDWQLVLILNGLVGIPIAILAATVAEPARRNYVADAAPAATPGGATLREVLAYLWKHRSVYGPIFVGLCFTSLYMFGLVAWRPAFFGRTYGWAPARIGLYAGLVNLALALPSLAGAIWMNDWFVRRGHADANMRVLAIAFSASAPLMILWPLMPDPWVALAMGGVGSAVMLFAAPSLNSAMQIVTPNGMRGRITALYLFTMTAVGGGFGPTFFALVTKYVVRDESLIRYTLAGTGAVLFPLAALIYWAGVKPYRERILALRAAGAPV